MTEIIYQLPEDLGQKQIIANGQTAQTAGSFPAGVNTAANSMPVVFPRSKFALPVIDRYRIPSEVGRDHLGIPRLTTPQAVVEAVDQFEIRSQDWIQEFHVDRIGSRHCGMPFHVFWQFLLVSQNTLCLCGICFCPDKGFGVFSDWFAD